MYMETPGLLPMHQKPFASKGEAITSQFDGEGNTTNRPKGLEEAARGDASGKQKLAALIHALKIWRCNSEEAFKVYVDHNPLLRLLEKDM